MPGLGTIINVSAIVIGGIFGLFFGKLIKERIRVTLLNAIGVCVMIIGLDGAIEKFIENYGPSSANKSVMLVVCMALGSIVGSAVDIDKRVFNLGEWLKKKLKSEENTEGGFANAFLTASVTVCVGAMAVVGSINDGINHDISVLFVKSVIDMITIMVMTASMGKGCIFSAVPLAVVQGGITAFATLIQPILTDKALSDLSLVGSVLIFCIGLSIMWKDKIKVANMLPAIIFAVIWAYIPISFL